jgi:flagellar protein FlaG
MTQIVSNASAVGDHSQGAFHHESDSQPRAAPPAESPDAAGEPASDVRLLIELDPANGGFVYKTVDRRTGAVIRKLPRDGVLELGEGPDYAAGKLIRTRA